MVNVKGVKRFLLSMKNNFSYLNKSGVDLCRSNGEKVVYYAVSKVETSHPGSFQNSVNGEFDLRTIYRTLIIADILNLLDQELTRGMSNFTASCQTYEGGFLLAYRSEKLMVATPFAPWPL